MAKKMTITSNAVDPEHEKAARKEKVKIHAEVDCTLWFNNGFALGLKKDGSCYVSFEKNGFYQFQVEYGAPMVAVQETVFSVSEAVAGGTAVVTETAVMAATGRSGPTGDITVP